MFSTHPFPTVGNVEPKSDGFPQHSYSFHSSDFFNGPDVFSLIAEQVIKLYENELSIANVHQMDDDAVYEFLEANCSKLFEIRNLLQINKAWKHTFSTATKLKAIILPIVIQLSKLRSKIPWLNSQLSVPPFGVNEPAPTIEAYFEIVDLCTHLREHYQRRHSYPPRLRRMNAMIGDPN